MSKNKKYVTKSYYIRQDQAEWLSSVAEYNDKTASKLVEIALDMFIEVIEAKGGDDNAD